MSSAGQTRIKIAVALMVALAVFLAVWGLRGAGLLQDLELTARDQTLRWGSDPAAAARPEHLFVVAATDADLARFGHPIPDAVLAEAIRRIGSAACCIGLDIYRGTPVPPGSDELSAALDAVPATVGVVKLARDGRIEAATHPTLADRGGYGVAFVPLDPDGTVRRGLLYLGAGGRTWPGFALQASLAYLAGCGSIPWPAR